LSVHYYVDFSLPLNEAVSEQKFLWEEYDHSFDSLHPAVGENKRSAIRLKKSAKLRY